MIFCDVFEPQNIRDAIRDLVPSQTIPLNSAGLADYMWQADGHTIQVERKQWAEIINIEHIEEQLQREYQKADETYLLIEGIMKPSQYGVDLYKETTEGSSRKVLYRCHGWGTENRPRKPLYQQIMAFLWSIDRQGISIVCTPNSYATALTIVTMYKQSIKTEHRTFNRYIRTKPEPFDCDPAVLTLMNLPGIELGEYRAKQLINALGSLRKVIDAKEEELVTVEGIGPVTAHRIKELFG